MKFQGNAVIKDLNGNPVQLDENGKVATLADIVQMVLLSPTDENVSGEDKMKRFKLAMKVSDNVDEISIEDAALIKQLVGKLPSPLIVGRVYQLMENE